MDVSPDIFVPSSLIDATIESSLLSVVKELEYEPLRDAETSVLIPFLLWPMLALNVRMLIGHGLGQGNSFSEGWIPFSFQNP